MSTITVSSAGTDTAPAATIARSARPSRRPVGKLTINTSVKR
jgi:hypothetical protein